MTRVAKMNMIMHGDGHAGIVNINGLLLDIEMPSRWKEEMSEGQFEIIYSNPPFAGREKDHDILRKFTLGKNKKDKPISVSKEVLFIELIIKMLKIGGKAGLVLPAGVFNNTSMKPLRDYIRAHTKILALIGLPHLAFQVSGANNEGHLLFIEKVESVPKDYGIFIDWASHVGINTIGQKIEQNDLLDIVERFKNPQPENIIYFSQLKDRIDPWYYHKNYERLTSELSKKGHEWKRIGDILKQSDELFDPKQCTEDKELLYIEKGDVDIEKGVILSYSKHTPKTIPNRATFILRRNDILFPGIYNSMRGIAIVPKEYNGYVCTNRFFVVRHNSKLINLEYAKHFFSRPEILALIKRECSGEINPGIIKDEFFNIKVPLPSIEEQQSILVEVHRIQERKRRLYKDIDSLDKEIDNSIRDTVPKVIDNYEDIKIVRAEYIGSVRFSSGRRRQNRPKTSSDTGQPRLF